MLTVLSSGSRVQGTGRKGFGVWPLVQGSLFRIERSGLWVKG